MDELIAQNRKRSHLVMFGFPVVVVLMMELVFGIIAMFTANTWKDDMSTDGMTLLAFSQMIVFIVMIWSVLYVLFKLWRMNTLIDQFPGAHQITSSTDFPVVWHIVEDVSMLAGVPMPKVYIIDTPELNAFSIGKTPETASIAITTGLLKHMNREQVEGVVAHEMGHIINRDTYVTGLAISVCGFIALMGTIGYLGLRCAGLRGGNRTKDSLGNAIAFFGLIMFLVTYLVALPLGTLLKAALSRQREYLADETSADITRNPDGIISALEVLKGADTTIAAGKPVMAMCIAGSDDGDDKESEKAGRKKVKGMAKLFSLDDHPPLADRIARLKQFYGEA